VQILQLRFLDSENPRSWSGVASSSYRLVKLPFMRRLRIKRIRKSKDKAHHKQRLALGSTPCMRHAKTSPYVHVSSLGRQLLETCAAFPFWFPWLCAWQAMMPMSILPTCWSKVRHVVLQKLQRLCDIYSFLILSLASSRISEPTMLNCRVENCKEKQKRS